MHTDEAQEQPGKREYTPPRLVRIGSIADVTRAESGGPGPLGAAPFNPGVRNGSDLDAETVGRIIGPGQ